MQRPHYHVISGDHEAMPDHNVAYRTKREAERGMVARMMECTEAAWSKILSLDRPERAKILAEAGKGATPIFSGSVREGYYEANYPISIVGLEYIELTTCYEPDCLEGLDDG